MVSQRRRSCHGRPRGTISGVDGGSVDGVTSYSVERDMFRPCVPGEGDTTGAQIHM